MGLQTLQLEHVPATHATHVALFRDVHNAAFLHSQLLSRNPDFEYAFIDASAIASTTHLYSAIFRAVTALLSQSLRTPNVHSEIVVSLSPSNNIAEAYRRLGVGPATKDVLVVKVTFPTVEKPDPQSAHDVLRHLTDNVRGEATEFTDDTISKISDWPRIRKFYKLNGLRWLDALPQDRKMHESEMIILGSMALRGV